MIQGLTVLLIFGWAVWLVVQNIIGAQGKRGHGR